MSSFIHVIAVPVLKNEDFMFIFTYLSKYDVITQIQGDDYNKFRAHLINFVSIVL